jgi:hypothetical protein
MQHQTQKEFRDMIKYLVLSLADSNLADSNLADLSLAELHNQKGVFCYVSLCKYQTTERSFGA